VPTGAGALQVKPYQFHTLNQPIAFCLRLWSRDKRADDIRVLLRRNLRDQVSLPRSSRLSDRGTAVTPAATRITTSIRGIDPRTV
jgi:hypothetical protein